MSALQVGVVTRGRRRNSEGRRRNTIPLHGCETENSLVLKCTTQGNRKSTPTKKPQVDPFNSITDGYELHNSLLPSPHPSKTMFPSLSPLKKTTKRRVPTIRKPRTKPLSHSASQVLLRKRRKKSLTTKKYSKSRRPSHKNVQLIPLHKTHSLHKKKRSKLLKSLQKEASLLAIPSFQSQAPAYEQSFKITGANKRRSARPSNASANSSTMSLSALDIDTSRPLAVREAILSRYDKQGRYGTKLKILRGLQKNHTPCESPRHFFCKGGMTGYLKIAFWSFSLPFLV